MRRPTATSGRLRGGPVPNVDGQGGGRGAREMSDCKVFLALPSSLLVLLLFLPALHVSSPPHPSIQDSLPRVLAGSFHSKWYLCMSSLDSSPMWFRSISLILSDVLLLVCPRVSPV